MALTKSRIDGLRAMYHNAGSSQGEKDNAKAILERNGLSVDIPKKASSGGTGTNPGYQKGGFDTGNGSFSFEFGGNEADFAEFFGKQFDESFFQGGRQQGRTNQQKQPKKVIVVDSLEKLLILQRIEKRVTGRLREDHTDQDSFDEVLRYHFEGINETHVARMIQIYRTHYRKIEKALNQAFTAVFSGI